MDIAPTLHVPVLFLIVNEHFPQIPTRRSFDTGSFDAGSATSSSKNFAQQKEKEDILEENENDCEAAKEKSANKKKSSKSSPTKESAKDTKESVMNVDSNNKLTATNPQGTTTKS